MGMKLSKSSEKNSIRLEINIAIIGQVSVGKSTFINSLFTNQYSDMKIKRTTMLPQIYEEQIDSSYTGQKNIREINRKSNEKIAKESEEKKMTSMKDLTYRVPVIEDFVKRPKAVKFTVYDIPGINDRRTIEACYKYLDDNFFGVWLKPSIISISNAVGVCMSVVVSISII